MIDMYSESGYFFLSLPLGLLDIGELLIIGNVALEDDFFLNWLVFSIFNE